MSVDSVGLNATDQSVVGDERPLASFVLIAYNQENFVREAIEGAFAQTYTPLEIIISDDCSLDNTFAVMQKMAAAYRGPHRVRCRQTPQNLGIVSHLSDVVSLAEGEFVCWAAGDDVSLPFRVEKLVEPILRDPGVYGTHSSVVEIDEIGAVLRTRNHPREVRNLTLDYVVSACRGVVTQAHAFRKEVFSVFGPFCEDITAEGAPMAFRELLLGRIEWVPEPTVRYRIGAGVSTARATTLEAVRVDEPVKVTHWRLGSIRQMQHDLEKVKDDHVALTIRLKMERIFFENLLDINTGKGYLRPLLENLRFKPRDGRSLRALARCLAPRALYYRIRGLSL